MANAGRLEPGAKYIYEKADGITYARKFNDPAAERIEIGRDYDAVGTMFGMSTARIAKIVDMIRAAEHNPALQEALDRAIIVYELSRQDQTVDHHPV